MCSAPESKGPQRRVRTIRPGAAITVTTMHATLWLAAPQVAEALTGIETLFAAAVIVTALYASQTLSDRAFRMLPWTTPQERTPPK
jgi:hypothetical protein